MNRAQLKKLSKSQLNGHWKVPVLLNLLYGVIVIAISLSQNYANSRVSAFIVLLLSLAVEVWAIVGFPNFYLKFIDSNDEAKYADFLVKKDILLKALGYVVLMTLVGVVVGAITGFMSVAMISYSIFGYGTFSGSVLPFILVVLVLGVILTIFSISISQSAYLLVDKDDINLFEAIGLSMKMMKGHKWEYFILYLSFIGWAILAILTLGIGFLWLTPYITLTFANFYKQLDKEYSKNEEMSQH